VLFLCMLICHGNADFVGPDVSSCGAIYGALSTSPCQVALQGLPTGSIPTIFTSRTSASDNNFVTLPKRYVDSEIHPSCAITIDLDGHSKDNVFVLVPWKKIRSIVQDIIDSCVDRSHWGGFETFGLQRTFDAMIDPRLIEPNEANNAVPAQVVQPDGTIDTSVVAIPPDTSSSGYGKLFLCSQCSHWSDFAFNPFFESSTLFWLNALELNTASDTTCYNMECADIPCRCTSLHDRDRVRSTH